MREVQVLAWCDLCESATPATVERTVSVDGGDTVLLDLCAEHDNDVFTILLVAMEQGVVEADVKPQPAKKSRREGRNKMSDDPNLDVKYRTCPICGDVPRTRSALGQHLYAKHNGNLTDYPEIALPK